MRSRSLLALPLVAAALLVGGPLRAESGLRPASQDADAPQHRRCKPCGTTGLVTCGDRAHKGVDLDLEGNLAYCSHVGDCDTCGGTGRVDCERCERPDAAERLGQMRARRDAARARHAELEAEVERSLPGGESEHFRLIWDLESMKVGRKRLDRHELLHLFAERMEAVHARYREVLEVEESAIPDRSAMAVWWLPTDHDDAARRWCGGSATMGVKRMGPKPFFSVCGNRSHFADDTDLHRYLVHNAAHLILSNHTPQQWMGQFKGAAWYDEGLASWLETDLGGGAQTWCFQEQDARGMWGGGKWRVALRKLVASEAAPSVAQVLQRDVNALEMVEQAVAFSLIDHLIHRDAAALPELGRRLKKKEPVRDALKEVYDLSPLTLERAWQAWVLETYPKR